MFTFVEAAVMSGIIAERDAAAGQRPAQKEAADGNSVNIIIR